MLKITVEVEPTANAYHIYTKPGGVHIKTCSTQYVVALIREYGLFFLDSDTDTTLYHPTSKKISSTEKAALAEHHYRELGKKLLADQGQYGMAEKLKNATVVNRRIDYNGDEKVYSIIFSSNLQVVVSDLHWRLFKIKPLLNNSTITFEQKQFAI